MQKRDRYISWDLADEIQDFAVNENGGYFVTKTERSILLKGIRLR